ncbi:MAG: SMC family ATPase [Anaerolineae bacterium]|nr:SMC family ATPase [Anaerolineae bacterium]MDW8172654.1 SMC family ATPase [Anaerolineae bacterium]
MIPLRLEMKNFLAYRNPDPLLLEGVHLACLVGANGAGKSSILDAITYGLWGKARASRLEDLIHQGQEELAVLLDFEQEGNVYRVERRKARSKRAASLSLFVRQHQSSWNDISEPNARDTQVKINAILRLDYDTFIASAFLQQGRADSFMLLQPAKRKELLSEMLGLARWRDYEERAKAEIDRIRQEQAARQMRAREWDEELAREPQHQAELQTAQADYQVAQAELEAAQARLEEVQSADADLKAAQDQQRDAQRRQADAQRDADETRRRFQDSQAMIERYQAVLANAASIEAAHAAYRAALDQDAALNEKFRQLSALREQRSQQERLLAQARAELDAQRAALDGEMASLRKQLSDDSAQALAKLQQQVAQLEADDVREKALQAAISQQREALASAEQRFAQVEKDGKALAKRIEDLEQAQAVCPFCGQTLSEDHRLAKLAELKAEREALREDYQDLKTAIAQAKAAIKRDDAEQRRLAQQLTELGKLRVRLGTLSQQVEAARQARARLAELDGQRAALLVRLEAGDYGQEIRARLAALQAEEAALGYDAKLHEQQRADLQRFRQYEDQHQQLAIARESLPHEQARQQEYAARLARLEEVIAREAEAVRRWEAEAARHVARLKERELRLRAVQECSSARDKAYSRLTTAQQELKALHAIREKRARLEEERARADHEQGLYQQLRDAFGKNGVPLMIIEAVIPQLEARANDYLSRMTDGRMHLMLKTERQTQEGKAVETLEIEIADELGTRPYELYSGGESFRINFALRVALSEVLAQRAGAHLRTLFIDEGFGTQDADGRAKLIDILNVVQDRFELILVITHIEELRDAFPLHIQVDKTPHGSRVSLG